MEGITPCCSIGYAAPVENCALLMHWLCPHLLQHLRVLPSHMFPTQNELGERRKALEEEEKALDTRYKTAAANLDAENKAARAEIAKARKVLAREKGELASKARNSAAEAEVAARKVRLLASCARLTDSLAFACACDNFDGVIMPGKEVRSRFHSCSLRDNVFSQAKACCWPF